MEIQLQLVLMNYLVFNLGVTCIGAHKKFILPCQNQTVNQPTYETNCTIFPAENATRLKLQKLISDPKVKVILLNINISQKARSNILENPVEFEHSNMHFYKQFRWQLVRLDVGRNLLFLYLKLRILDPTKIIGFRTVDIDLRSEPSGCLTKLSHSTFGYLIRKLILDYTADAAPQGKKKLSVCNQVITGNQGIADFRTICYTHKTKHQISCDFLKTSDGWEYLLVLRNLIAVVTILFGPFLIPARLFSLKRSEYLFHLPEEIPVTRMITRTRHTCEPGALNYDIPIEQFPDLENNCQVIEKEYDGWMKALYLDIDERKIIPRGCAAAELSRLLYNRLFRCKYHSDQTQTCLGARLFPFNCRRYEDLTWYRCCRWFMDIVLLLLLPLPWILRLVIYYRYEYKDFTDRTNAAKLLNLKLPFTGWILDYIPPLHWSFLFVYSLYFLDLLFFGILNCSKRNNLVEIIKEALRAMREHANLQKFRFHAESLLFPLKRFGLPGLVLLPFYWIVLIPTLLLFYIFQLVPMIRSISCLLKNIIIYCSPYLLTRFGPVNAKHLRFQERFIKFMITCLFLLSLVSSGILITECVCYLMKVFFYAFIILILKADDILPYISLGFLVVFYFFENVNAVCTKYNNFQKEITDKIIQEIGDRRDFTSVNTAYATNKSVATFNDIGEKGLIYHSVSLLLFLDSRHRPHIPERFFYEICHLPFVGCPGSLMISYLKALRRFLVILFFLGFVLIVVRTFFGLYNVSSTNQMLATLAGGFLPLFITRLIKMNSQTHQVDMDTISFKTHFKRAMGDYAEDWVISGFEIEVPECDTTDGPPTSPSVNCVIDRNFFVNLKLRSAKRETTV